MKTLLDPTDTRTGFGVGINDDGRLFILSPCCEARIKFRGDDDSVRCQECQMNYRNEENRLGWNLEATFEVASFQDIKSISLEWLRGITGYTDLTVHVSE